MKVVHEAFLRLLDVVIVFIMYLVMVPLVIAGMIDDARK